MSYIKHEYYIISFRMLTLTADSFCPCVEVWGAFVKVSPLYCICTQAVRGPELGEVRMLMKRVMWAALITEMTPTVTLSTFTDSILLIYISIFPSLWVSLYILPVRGGPCLAILPLWNNPYSILYLCCSKIIVKLREREGQRVDL